MQGIDGRDEATQKASAVRYGNYSQFLHGVEGLRDLRLGIVRQGKVSFLKENSRGCEKNEFRYQYDDRTERSDRQCNSINAFIWGNYL